MAPAAKENVVDITTVTSRNAIQSESLVSLGSLVGIEATLAQRAPPAGLLR
jgi:hypothetical protein